MKVLLALALLLGVGADGFFHTLGHVLGHHNPMHHLSSSPWPLPGPYVYDLTINMTVGVPGMTSQVAKSLIEMDVIITKKTETEYTLEGSDISISDATSSVPSSDFDMHMHKDTDLEKYIRMPVEFVYKDGLVTDYTFEEGDVVRSTTIKRGILRHLSMYLPANVIPRTNDKDSYPIIYNDTECNEMGSYDAYYSIKVIPYPYFPYEDTVFNITKTVNYEPYHYPRYFEKHNFDSQGCPGLCSLEKHNHETYGPRCPEGYEPNKIPLKATTVLHHNYMPKDEKMILEIFKAEDVSIAKMYGQDIETWTESLYVLKDYGKVLKHQIYQDEHRDRNFMSKEDKSRLLDVSTPEEYKWLYDVFDDINPSEIIEIFRNILNDVVTSIIEAEADNVRGQEVAHKVSHLGDLMSFLRQGDLVELWKDIPEKRQLKTATAEQKIKRQIFLDILPFCGTHESISFATSLVREEKLLTWEAKELLDVIPANIIEPDEENIKTLRELLDATVIKECPILLPSALLALSRTVREGCIVPLFYPQDDYIKDESSDSPDRREQFRKPLRKMKKFTSWYAGSHEESKTSEDCTPRKEMCRMELVEELYEKMKSDMVSAREMWKKTTYIVAIAHLGYNKSLEALEPYAFGKASDISHLAPFDVDFIKTVAIYSVHAIVELYPNETLKIAAPVYFNRTEAPRVRIAAFSVLIRSHPPLGVLQHVAVDSWVEPSREVGSYVYSALQKYGNTTTPWMILNADAIKLVISQTKAYDIGHQYSKSIIKTFFDDLRNVGITLETGTSHSNESAIPYNLYSALEYNIESLKDFLFRFDANIQGDIIGTLVERIFPELVDFIPKDIEKELLGLVKLVPRMSKPVRITLYKKIFYSTSLVHFDSETISQYAIALTEFLTSYFGGERGVFSGHYVKTFIPSSLHTVTNSSMEMPIEFSMKHPLVCTIKIESEKPPTREDPSFKYRFTARAYYGTYQRKTIMNIVDGHAYGAYHKHELTFSPPPVEISFNKRTDTIEAKWDVSEGLKRIQMLRSEAGTFETDLKLRNVYADYDVRREPIKTIPGLFKHDRVLKLLGLPIIKVLHYSEDIQDPLTDIPLILDGISDELIDRSIRIVANPEWRRRSVNVTFVPDINEIIFKMHYNRSLYIERKSHLSKHSAEHSEDRAPFHFNVKDDTQRSDTEEESILLPGVFTKTGCSGAESDELSPEDAKLLPKICFPSHISNILDIKIETLPNKNSGELRVKYIHTLDRMEHILTARAEKRTSGRTIPKMNLLYHMLFKKSPSQFDYNYRTFTGQQAIFTCDISFDGNSRGEDVIAKGHFEKIPYKQLFEPSHFVVTPDDDAFLPETSEECLRDIRKGKSQSPACIDAVIEDSYLNTFQVTVRNIENLPPVVKNITYKLERALHHHFFERTEVDIVTSNPSDVFEMRMNYYNVLTDKLIFDIWMKTKDRKIKFNKIDLPNIMPISSILPVSDIYAYSESNNTYPPSCGLMENYVRTYDMKMFELPRDTCTYVLSTDCNYNKTFIVLADRSAEDTTEITIQVGAENIKLIPAKNRHFYTLEYDGKRYILIAPFDTYGTLLLKEDPLLYVYLVPALGNPKRSILVVEAPKVGLKIEYDERNTKIQVHPFYKGHLCGLCGQFTGETTWENVAPNQCLYLDDADFVHQSIVDPKQCGKNTELEGPYICPYGEEAEGEHERRYKEHSYAEGSRRPRQRTVTEEKRHTVCFSIKPVPLCDEESQPEEEYTVSVAYHCLPKNDVTTRRLLVESRDRVLTELASKKVDHTGVVSAAKSCSPY